MKLFLLLPLLLGAISACHLGDNSPPPECLDTQDNQSQDIECPGEHRGELALHGEEIPSGEEEVEASGCQETFEDKDNLDSDPAASENFECPKEEDTVQLQGTPWCKTCHPVILVKMPWTFSSAKNMCRKCYKSNLVSTHNQCTNNQIQSLASEIKQGQVWIGAIKDLFENFEWTIGAIGIIHTGP